MPLPDKEPNVTIRDLLQDKWTDSHIDGDFDTAWIGTGWWDESTPNPQVTVTSDDLPTGPDGLAAGGTGLSSWVDGTIDVNAWVPYDSSKSYTTGEAKDLRWSLTREIHRIVENNQSGWGPLSRIVTATIRRNPSDDPPPYRMYIPVNIQFRTAPE